MCQPFSCASHSPCQSTAAWPDYGTSPSWCQNQFRATTEWPPPVAAGIRWTTHKMSWPYEASFIKSHPPYYVLRVVIYAFPSHFPPPLSSLEQDG